MASFLEGKATFLVGLLRGGFLVPKECSKLPAFLLLTGTHPSKHWLVAMNQIQELALITTRGSAQTPYLPTVLETGKVTPA